MLAHEMVGGKGMEDLQSLKIRVEEAWNSLGEHPDMMLSTFKTDRPFFFSFGFMLSLFILLPLLMLKGLFNPIGTGKNFWRR